MQQQELDGVQLGMSMLDVRLKKGEPTKSIVIFPSDGTFEPDTAVSADNSKKAVNVFDQFDDPPPMRVVPATESTSPPKNTWQWTYGQSGDLLLVVVFDNESNVAAICGQSNTLFGISVGMPETLAADKLGTPTHTSIRQDGLSKIITYPSWRVAFEIEKARVVAICVTTEHLRFTRELQTKR